jgi:hypothetical protein
MRYITQTINRWRYHELQKAVDEKLADGWEIVKMPEDTTKSWRSYDPHGNRFDSHVAKKFTCVLRKERDKVLAGRNG